MFGKLRQQHLTDAARDVQRQLAGMTDLDKAPMRAALEGPPPNRAALHWAPKPPKTNKRKGGANSPAPTRRAAPAATGRPASALAASPNVWREPLIPASFEPRAESAARADAAAVETPVPASSRPWARAWANDPRPLPTPAMAGGAAGDSTLIADPDDAPIEVPAASRYLPVPVSTDLTNPQVTDDTMIVTAPQAWDLYRRTAAYICEPGRAFRPVRYVAFFMGNTLQREVPRIIAVRDAVPFHAREQRRLMDSGTELDLRLAEVIARARQFGVDGEVHQVYLLTAPGQPGHVRLAGPVTVREGRRRRRDWLSPKLRYTSVERLGRVRSRR